MEVDGCQNFSQANDVWITKAYAEVTSRCLCLYWPRARRILTADRRRINSMMKGTSDFIQERPWKAFGADGWIMCGENAFWVLRLYHQGALGISFGLGTEDYLVLAKKSVLGIPRESISRRLVQGRRQEPTEIFCRSIGVNARNEARSSFRRKWRPGPENRSLQSLEDEEIKELLP